MGSAWARDLPHDERLLTGKLENGVTWIYRQHDNPPGRMALMIHVRSGSLNETDTQKGLAHFLEHMAFNGTEHFAPGKLVPYFESIGMQFGADLNAYTSFDQTVYMLYTPDTKAEQIDKALMVLSDYAFRESLVEAEINKERGVILEEARSGKGVGRRIRDKLWPELFEGSRFASRIPIGDDDIIAHAPRKEFVDYYNQWYRPENVTVLLAGDAKPDEFIPLIKKWFGEFKPATAAQKPRGTEFKPFSRQRAIVVTDPEMAGCEVEMVDLRAGRPAATTTEQWRAEYVESIGSWILERRLDERVKNGKAAYREGDARVSNFFNDAVMVNVSVKGEPSDWKTMLADLVGEVKRLREGGFTERELGLARKAILAGAEHAVQTEPTLNARGILMTVVGAVNDGTPVLSAQQNLDLCREFLPGITIAELNKVFQDYFASNSFAYVMTMPEKKGAVPPSREDVLAVVAKAWETKVEKVTEEELPKSILAEIPRPGKVTESQTDPDFQVTSAWLDNGVRVHHRFMDYKKDAVYMSISLAGGDIEETAQNAGITGVSTLAVNEAATRHLSSTVLRDLMTGKQINVGAGGEEDAFTIQLSGSPSDLESGLQEAYALLTEGKIEESAFKNWKVRTLDQIEEWEKMPTVQASAALEDLLSGGEARRMLITKAGAQGQSIAEAQGWFDRLSRESPIEVSIVGDISWDKAKALAERYLGALPKRSRSAERLDGLRATHRTKGPLVRHLKVKTITPQALVLVGFVGPEGRNTKEARALQMAATIMTSRLIKTIREDLSLVYSIHASSAPSWAYRDDGRWLVSAPCDPSHVEKVSTEIERMLQEFGEKGPTEEELANAKKQIGQQLDVGMREPGYWSGVLKHYDLNGRKLEDEKRKKEDYQGFTAQQVKDAFRKYHIPERSFLVTAVPEGAK